MRKYLEKELIKQVTYITGRKPYMHELILAWFQMKSSSDEDVLTALVGANELAYTKKRFLGR